jgi:hypothetical protein
MKFSDRGCHQQHLSSSSERLSRPKFQTAYSDIEDRRKRRILTFDIEKIDSSISLSTVDCLCIVGERKYTNSILMRLCVRALISKRQDGFESTNVFFLDAGNNLDVFYKCVNFTRQYGLNIKKVLQSIMMTRAFTIYQLADLLIYELPRIIEQFNNNGNVAVVMIADLLNLFTNDPNIDLEEAIFLIKEIIISIRKTLDNTLVVVSFQQYNNNDHTHKSYAEYDKILLPRFDKRIEITRNNNDSNSNINLLDVKIYNNNKQSKKNCSRSFLLEKRDLQIIPVPR